MASARMCAEGLVFRVGTWSIYPFRPIRDCLCQRTFVRKKQIVSKTAVSCSTRPQIGLRSANDTCSHRIPLCVAYRVAAIAFVHRERLEAALPGMTDETILAVEITCIVPVCQFNRLVKRVFANRYGHEVDMIVH